MRRPRLFCSCEAVKELYRQSLVYLFKWVVYTFSIIDWLIGLIKKHTR